MSRINNDNRSSLQIDYLNNSRYRVMNRQDLDGDGVTDGSSLSGDAGRVVNENAVNQLLAMRGLQMRDGNMQSVDGFFVGSTNVSAVNDFSGIPPLPASRGGAAMARPESVAQRARAAEVGEGIEDSALMWQALSTMAYSAQREMHDAKEVKHAMQRGKLEAKRNEIDSTQRQIEAERAAAQEAFAWSVVSAVVTVGVGSMTGSDAVAGAAGNVASSFGTMMSKTSGAQREADDAKVETMRHQMQQETFEQNVESAKASYDEARENFRLALKIIAEHGERQTQIVNTITRT